MEIPKQIITTLLLSFFCCRLGCANDRLMAFESVNGLVYVEARINGSNPVPMVLDTGASDSIVSPSVARLLRLGTASSIQAAGPGRGSDETMPVASGVTIDIGPIELKNRNLAVLAVDYIAVQAGHATEGILSVGAFAPQVVEVDYQAKRVRFIDAPDFSPSPESVEVPVVIGSHVPLVRAEIGLPNGGSTSGTFILDSGAANTMVLLSKPFIGRHPELLQTGDRIDLPPVEAGGANCISSNRPVHLQTSDCGFHAQWRRSSGQSPGRRNHWNRRTGALLRGIRLFAQPHISGAGDSSRS